MINIGEDNANEYVLLCKVDVKDYVLSKSGAQAVKEVARDMEYEVDSGIGSGYESSDSEGEKRELSETSEKEKQEGENNQGI